MPFKFTETLPIFSFQDGESNDIPIINSNIIVIAERLRGDNVISWSFTDIFRAVLQTNLSQYTIKWSFTDDYSVSVIHYKNMPMQCTLILSAFEK